MPLKASFSLCIPRFYCSYCLVFILHLAQLFLLLSKL
ncbi:hypothetical protein EU509_15475 [Pseudoalteromonas fuliginea]|uniref:Uncharacterized protein n=1 Tax=Pseudoalteromonas fuliginea TaxID=1872678 RepID=A0A833AKV8_9GAMM|nr:hypothetical protein EU509_15475 [Pseudoalteromonas fuliginea]KAA1159886.1 hypothetical protein EU508_11610 [Pseudoalteromonas fuliginea]KAA1166389.1 hypothetical protein EUZ79_15465 [Pseudoalteromonas fuliginea]